MPRNPTLYDQAIERHQSGDLVRAEYLYLEILKSDPRHFAACHMLGILRAQQGRSAEALTLIETAINANPRSADARTNLGNVLIALGRYQEALASFDKSLALQTDPITLNSKGSVLHRIGRLDEALECYEQAIARSPRYAEAAGNRANTLLDLERYLDAIAAYDKALLLEPGNARAWSSRGNALQQLEQYAQAVQSYDQALKISPDDAHTLSNRSISLWSGGSFAAALKSADLALAINPLLAPTWSHRGNVLRALGCPQDALGSYDRAISLDGDSAEAHLNKSYCLLLAGRWREGWPLFEWRKRLDVPIAARTFRQPLWTGTQDLGGKTLFTYAEQGLGDTIQFFRYCALARSRGAQVVLAAQNGLVRLLNAAGVTVTDIDAVPPHFDYHIALMSLPLAFSTVVENVPAAQSYLKAEPDKAREWAATIGKHGFKIGIAWRGDDRGARKGRSFPLTSLEKLARLPDVRLISLQKDATEAELRTGAPGMNLEILGDRLDRGPDAFIDTAAIMQNLDLVITADTSIAHLAGALGVRTWIALKHLPDWRWPTDRADSPWYPSVILYRQAAEGDWASVFDQMEPSLAGLLA